MAIKISQAAAIPMGLDTKKMRKAKKNNNQTDLFELAAHLEQLEQISLELKMIESLGQLELSTIIEKQIDWVELDED